MVTEAARDDRRWAVMAAIVGTIVTVDLAVLGAVQTLVLNPMAAVPGATLDQIGAELAAADESLGTLFVIGVMGLGAALAGALLILAVRGRWDVRVVAMLYLALLVLGTPAYWIASFGAGIALADTYGISGADHSPWATPLYVASGTALVTFFVVAVARRPVNRRPRSPAD